MDNHKYSEVSEVYGMVVKGFRFGMLLQLAVGPVCIFIFQAASLRGFLPAETGVAGVALIDGLYILAALLGVAAIIDKREVKFALKMFGGAILVIFGLSTVLSLFGINLLPVLSLQESSGSGGTFLRAVIITASSPLTIIFWAGVFSGKIAEESMNRKEIYCFGIGALLSTVFFLTLVAFVGSITKTFLPPIAIQAMNFAVGCLLIFFGIRMLLKKT